MQHNHDDTIGLLKVSYKIRRESHAIDLILRKGKKNRFEIAQIISAVTDEDGWPLKIRTKFRKHFHGYTPDISGNKTYHSHLQTRRDERRRAGQAMRKYTLYKRKYPFKPTSETILFSRHLFSDIEDLHNTIRREHANQKLQYRFDIQFGLKLRNVETGKLKTFYPSQNTSFYSDDRQLPIVTDSIDNIMDNLKLSDIIDKAKRPNSKWSIDEVYEYVLLITPFPGKLIGSDIQLPSWITKSKSIIGLESVKNNMCFWNCLAYHQNRNAKLDRLVRAAKQLFEQYYGHKLPKDYKGVDILEIPQIEDTFKVNINVYVMSEISVDIERHSSKSFMSTMNLNLHSDKDTEQHHFSYIKNIQNITKVFKCADCNTYLSEYKKLKPHSLSAVEYQFDGK